MNEQEILAHIINLMFKCFDCKVAQIQLVCIEKTYVLCQKVSFNDMKTKLIPRILMLCNDPDVKVKKRALIFVKERIDLLDPSLVQSQAFSIIESNLGQNNPASINFLILDLMEEISKSYDVDLIASKILPILIGFLANKTSTRDEFERYHESVLKFINRVKDKRLKEFSSQPFKAKPEEPDDSSIVIQPLETLVNNTKVDGLDNLFAKQNQFGHGHGVTTPSPSTSNGQSGNVFNFPDISPGTDQTGNMGLSMTFGNDFTLGNPSPSNIHSLPEPQKGSLFPKPPEKGTSHELPSSGTFGQSTQTKKPLNFGSLTGLSLGNDKKPPTSAQSNPHNPGNYSAFDELDFGNNLGGGLTLGGGGLGSTQAGNQMMGSTISSFNLSGGTMMDGSKPQHGNSKPNDFGLTFGGGLNNGMGIGGLSLNDHNDPFQRGMDGLMLGNLGNTIQDSNSFGNAGFGNPNLGMTFGMQDNGFNSMGGMGSLGGSRNMGGMGSLGGSGNFGGMGSLGGSGNMGGMNSMNGMGTLGGGMSSGMMDLNLLSNSTTAGGLNNKPTFGGPQKPQAGILSNPNLTFKSKEADKKPSNNFNDFDLL